MTSSLYPKSSVNQLVQKELIKLRVVALVVDLLDRPKNHKILSDHKILIKLKAQSQNKKDILHVEAGLAALLRNQVYRADLFSIFASLCGASQLNIKLKSYQLAINNRRDDEIIILTNQAMKVSCRSIEILLTNGKSPFLNYFIGPFPFMLEYFAYFTSIFVLHKRSRID